MRVVKLREKYIQISEILQDEQSGVITVYIFDKQHRLAYIYKNNEFHMMKYKKDLGID